MERKTKSTPPPLHFEKHSPLQYSNCSNSSTTGKMILMPFKKSLSSRDLWKVGRRGFFGGGFWNSVTKVMTADAVANKITIYSAMENKGIGSIADNGWKTFNDQDYGGSSHCEAKIMRESLSSIDNAAILDVSLLL